MSKLGSRVVVIGWDGISFPLAQKLAGEGYLPHLAKLLTQGSSRPMRTEHPPLSPVCWTSFFTGANPGQHRIFGFFEPTPDAYAAWEQNLSHVKLPGLWDYAGAAGLRSVVLNLPGTYPAAPLQGVMVSGFPVGDESLAVYPRSLAPVLEQIGYCFDVDCREVPADPAGFFRRCAEAIQKRGHVFRTFLENEPLDLFIGVFTELDRVQHYFFAALEEENHPWRAEVLGLFSLLDEQLGLCLAATKPEDDLWIVADHGFRRIQLEVCPNALLEEIGWLRMKSGALDPAEAKELNGIEPKQTRAFCLDPGRVFLNIAGRQPAGVIPASVRREQAEELRHLLLQTRIRLPWLPEPACPFGAIHFREEVYRGPYLGLAPDLILVPADGIDLKGVFGAPGVSRLREFTGMHSADDAFLFRRGPHALPLNPILSELAKPILHQLGIDGPSL
jgi:predicted AlkP superfamily phosphohydrolase/phosphomutase